MDTMLTEWREATSKLPWGVNQVFRTVFTLVKDEQIHLVHGADYRDGKPCLVNAVGQMLTTGGGNGIPSKHFGTIVGLFDRINAELQKRGVNKNDGYVSPLAAEILLQHFTLVEKPADDMPILGTVVEAPYVEPSDTQMIEWLSSMEAPAPELVQPLAEAGDPCAQYLRDMQVNEQLMQDFAKALYGNERA